MYAILAKQKILVRVSSSEEEGIGEWTKYRSMQTAKRDKNLRAGVSKKRKVLPGRQNWRLVGTAALEDISRKIIQQIRCHYCKKLGIKLLNIRPFQIDRKQQAGENQTKRWYSVIYHITSQSKTDNVHPYYGHGRGGEEEIGGDYGGSST